MTRPAADAPILVWFRRDLRTADHPALAAAVESGAPVLPVYVLDDDPPRRPLGAAARWWLHFSLEALSRALTSIGSPLLLRHGPAAAIVEELALNCGARAVFWNRDIDPRNRARDETLRRRLVDRGIEVRDFAADLLVAPDQLKSASGTPYRVFTPFWKACRRLHPALPLAPPPTLRSPAARPAGDRLDSWSLLPHGPDWAGGLRRAWTPGADAARNALAGFVETGLRGYASARDRPGESATSRLSPHLAFGEIGPREIWHAAMTRIHEAPELSGGGEAFLRELGWREFCQHQLLHQPNLPEQPMRGEFTRFPWRRGGSALAAWQRGRTGYPIVDAGMRELWHTGWMHNRVRMVAASFLVKQLLISWRDGEAWFWDTLVDADPANNPANWQWVAGCGADAAPYFRIFNPVRQGERFDPDGFYVRRWCPELARLPDRFIHKPWEAPGDVLEDAGVRLGPGGYPYPIVELRAARERALAAFAAMRDG